MRQIITHFTDDDLYKFTMCCAVIDNYPRAQVKYSFTDRGGTVYPKGFARELEQQIAMLEDVVITDEEIAFMKRRCRYIPHWFYSFLRGFRYDARLVTVRQDASGHLEVEFEGCWTNTILLEVKVLAIISELYLAMTGREQALDLGAFAEKTRAKARRLIEGGCTFSDFGTRRRASFAAQAAAIGALCAGAAEAEGPGRFMGTSNIYFAMKHDLVPVGTMAHEIIAAIGGMYGPQMANHIAMKAWSSTYRGSLGTFLYDTFGWEIFSLNFSEDFANMFKGLRVDSGDNRAELDKIVAKYRSLGIEPATKQVVFSNALTVDDALEIQRFAAPMCQPSFGIGTHFTHDFPGVAPLNIVIKLVAAKITESWPFYNETCKLSEDASKHTGDPAVVRRFMEALHLLPPERAGA
ncbi:MAG: nicotinate phosphoribosyltransferase [Desulfovibrio sp.]|nr:nicotinate phosphoribosyltransferase [Desulfovibrio sp.]